MSLHAEIDSVFLVVILSDLYRNFAGFFIGAAPLESYTLKKSCPKLLVETNNNLFTFRRKSQWYQYYKNQNGGIEWKPPNHDTMMGDFCKNKLSSSTPHPSRSFVN